MRKLQNNMPAISEILYKERQCVGDIPTIQLEDVTTQALRDEQSRNTTEFLYDHREKSPSRDELDTQSLTELNYLALQTDGMATLRSFPGGVASPLAVDILKADLQRLHEQYQGIPIQVLAMIHGTVVPKVGNEPPSLLAKEWQRYHQFLPGNDDVHNEMSCGIACGHLNNVPFATKVTREQADDNLRLLRDWAAEQGIAIDLIPIEADVKPDSATPSFRVYNETPLEAEDTYNEDVNPETFMDVGTFNNFLRERMDKGTPIAGLACSDRRQGTMTPHESVGRVDIQTLGEQLEHGLGPIDQKLNPIRRDWSGWGHTEFAGVPIIGNDAEMQQLAVYLLQNQAAILRKVRVHQRGTYISDAGLFLVNLPQSVAEQHAETIAQGLTNLVSRLDTDIYRPGPIGRSATRAFMRLDGTLTEVQSDSGLQVVIPRGWGEFAGTNMKPGRVLLDIGQSRNDLLATRNQQGIVTEGAIFSQSRPIVSPWSRRQIGPQIEILAPTNKNTP